MGRLTHELTRQLISHFVEDLLATSRLNLGDDAPQSADDVRQAGRPLIAFSETASQDLAIIKSYLFTHMWRHYKVNRMTSKARRTVKSLFTYFYGRAKFDATRLAKKIASQMRRKKHASLATMWLP